MRVPNQLEYLHHKLKEINKQLPAAVYLPFVHASKRNYAVLHIAADESRIFKTKERAPLLLCIEVYRPIELSLEKLPYLQTDYDVPDQVDADPLDDMILSSMKKRRPASRSLNDTTARSTIGVYPFVAEQV